MGSWRWILCFAVLCTVGPSVVAAAAADARPLALEHLTTADGLPQATVRTPLQDSQGFVWLATEDGLVRFDGQQLVRYAHSRTAPGTLPGNFIYQVVEDADHDLWIAVKDAGLARWSRATNSFTTYRHDPADPSSLASNAVRALLLDTQGRLWVATSDAGISILDRATGRFEHLRHDPDDPASLVSDRIFTLALDSDGNVLVGTEANGLYRWDVDSRRFTHLWSAEADAGAGGARQISRVLEDRSGSLWVATFDGGVIRMDREGHVLERFRHTPGQGASLSSNDVRAILEDRAGHLWIGTADGLDLLDRSTGRFVHYRHDPGNAESLRDSFIMSLYEDASGLLWIGTRAGGVSRWNPRSWELGGHRPKWLGNTPVTAFADAPDNDVWIASLDGLVRFDADTGTATSIDEVLGRRNVLGDQRAMSLRLDRLGNLWIGTMSGGLKKLTRSGRIESVPVQPGHPRSLSAPGVMTLVESRSGQLWIGTYGGGANVLDPATGLIRQLPHDTGAPGAISASIVTSIAEDARGNLWIGTDGGGLNLARADGTVVRVFRNDPGNPASLPANTVYALAVDSQDRVWVGTDSGGLALVLGSSDAPDSIRFRVISREQGLTSDAIYGVLPDSAGEIWLSGNAGLMRFDPDTGQVKTYHREHGLQGEEFSFGAYYRLRDGRLCFGGPGGFNIFNPARLSENRNPPRLALTHLEILGVPAPGPVPYWLRDRIELDHRASIVSLDFGVLDFTSPEHNRLAYRMAGLTDRWIEVGAQRRITLTNLDAGDHILEVRAANSDSVWTPTPLRLHVHKAPAPWRSPGAYVLYAFVVLALIAWRVHRQRAKFQEMARARERLEAEVQLRTRELVESNLQLEEAARAKSNFLDRMSHELRTPMNGVVGMTELLARTQLSATQSRLTQTIRSSAQVLLQIVNDLLDLSKIQAGKVELEQLPLDLVDILEECTSLFAGAAENKGIELIVSPPAREDVRLLGDPLRIRQIVMNLVGNAVKFTARGEIVVRADIDPAEQAEHAVLRLSVADTGIGMDAATIDRIFEPFTQADESTTRRFGGSGLGLAICRELAELMGGSIGVESRPQVGSTFTLRVSLRVASEGTAPAVALPAARVQILTRRPSFAESLARHASALGLIIIPGEEDGAAAQADVVLVDAASHADFLKRHADVARARRAAVIALATSAEAVASRLEQSLGATRIVYKPVHRAALREALCAALGVNASKTDLPTHAAPNTPAVGGHVLLVEDEPVNAEVARGYLSELGCTCVWVKDGMEAVARVAAERFDLILMDLSMPSLDGFATTALIRQRDTGQRVPIVALTAHDAVGYRETCLKAGMDDLLTKPYTLEQCAQMLRRWITRKPTATPVTETHPPEAAQRDQSRSVLSAVDAAAVAGLRKLRSGSQADLYSRLVDLFQSSSSESLARLQSALDSGDFETAGAVCHKLTSSAANVGALAFASQVRELGQACKTADAARAKELNEALQAAHPALIEELTCLRLKASA